MGFLAKVVQKGGKSSSFSSLLGILAESGQFRRVCVEEGGFLIKVGYWRVIKDLSSRPDKTPTQAKVKWRFWSKAAKSDEKGS